MVRSPHQVLAVVLLAAASALSVYLYCQHAPIKTSLSIYDQYARAHYHFTRLYNRTIRCIRHMPSIHTMRCADTTTTLAIAQLVTVMMTAIPKEHGVSWVQRGCRLPTLSAIPFPSAKVHLLRISFSCARDFDSIRLSLPLLGFDSLVVGTSVGSAPQKYSRVQLYSPERSSFLHRHHLKVTVVTV